MYTRVSFLLYVHKIKQDLILQTIFYVRRPLRLTCLFVNFKVIFISHNDKHFLNTFTRYAPKVHGQVSKCLKEILQIYE